MPTPSPFGSLTPTAGVGPPAKHHCFTNALYSESCDSSDAFGCPDGVDGPRGDDVPVLDDEDWGDALRAAPTNDIKGVPLLLDIDVGLCGR